MVAGSRRRPKFDSSSVPVSVSQGARPGAAPQVAGAFRPPASGRLARSGNWLYYAPPSPGSSLFRRGRPSPRFLHARARRGAPPPQHVVCAARAGRKRPPRPLHAGAAGLHGASMNERNVPILDFESTLPIFGNLSKHATAIRYWRDAACPFERRTHLGNAVIGKQEPSRHRMHETQRPALSGRASAKETLPARHLGERLTPYMQIMRQQRSSSAILASSGLAAKASGAPTLRAPLAYLYICIGTF